MDRVREFWQGLSRNGKIGVVAASVVAVGIIGGALDSGESADGSAIEAGLLDTGQTTAATVAESSTTAAETATTEPPTTTQPPTTTTVTTQPPTTVTTKPPTTTQATTTTTTTHPPTTTTTAAENCHASYPDVCIPPPPPDLNCGDISYRRFRVVGSDPHRFDGDNDGVGCES